MGVLRWRLCVLIGVLAFLPAVAPSPAPGAGAAPSACSVAPAGGCSGGGCTVFYAAGDGAALGGSKEDASNPFTYVRFVPAAPGEHGRVYCGFEDGFPQGGVNDAGLFLG